jgi:hypothetical protein
MGLFSSERLKAFFSLADTSQAEFAVVNGYGFKERWGVFASASAGTEWKHVPRVISEDECPSNFWVVLMEPELGAWAFRR